MLHLASTAQTGIQPDMSVGEFGTMCWMPGSTSWDGGTQLNDLQVTYMWITNISIQDTTLLQHVTYW